MLRARDLRRAPLNGSQMSAGAAVMWWFGLDPQDGSLVWPAINAGCRLGAQLAVSAEEPRGEFSSMAISQ